MQPENSASVRSPNPQGPEAVPKPFRYADWIKEHVARREKRYVCNAETGLLSFLTTVWNTPLEFLRPAAESLLKLQSIRDFQWVILDNGSTQPEIIQFLKETVAADDRVVYLRAEQNLGIIGGMRLVLSNATGRYVLPFDSDDLLYPDAVSILTCEIKKYGYPSLLYTDEDKVIGNEACAPYFKPDWDPVLFLNCCYIAHLCCIDRTRAMDLGVYSDTGSEGSHDWDTFMRFMLAGHVPVHIPEVLYSWRIHQNSTAGNINSKNYIFDSQRNVLSRFLKHSPNGGRFDLQTSPLFNGLPEWWMQRKAESPAEFVSIVLGTDAAAIKNIPPGLDNKPQLFQRMTHISARSDIRAVIPLLDQHTGLICITFDHVRLNQPLWPLEATGLFELHPDLVMAGGRIVHPSGRILDAGRVPGFGGLYGCPDRGRTLADPGNIVEMWKQRSVSGVSTQFCVMRTEFLRQVINDFVLRPVSWFCLGAWAALSAWRQGQRIAYSPFLIGVSEIDIDQFVSQEEALAFQTEARDFLPDNRFYNRNFGMLQGQGYLPVH